jgi:hypothetical protein
MQQLDRAATRTRSRVDGNQLAKTKAVEVSYAAKVENDILVRAVEKFADGPLQGRPGRT